jgi:magnesium chelatase family protein
VARPDEAGRQLLLKAAEQLQLTARGYHRVLRTARTIADIEGVTAVRRIHIAESLGLRRRTVQASDTANGAILGSKVTVS